MYKKILLIGAILTITILVIGCGGVSQSDYDNAQSTIASQNATITELQNQIDDMVYPPKYFNDKAELKNWLTSKPSFAECTTYYEWYMNALTMQRWAFEDGYILSVTITSTKSYIYHDIYVYVPEILCFAHTQSGIIYSFNPNNRYFDQQIDTNELNINIFD